MTSQKEVRRSMNAFAKNFFKSLKDVSGNIDGNIFFSPPNIYAVLSMLKAGADKLTETSLKNVLCISPDDTNDFDETFCKVWKGILKANNNDRNIGTFLNLANRLWIQAGFDVKDDYIEKLGTYFLTYLITKDFRNNVGEAINYINKWIEGITDGRINDLMNKENVTPMTNLLITSVVSFNGSWNEPFDATLTTEMPFFTSSGEEIPVQMMYIKSSFYYQEDDELNCKILALKYESPSTLRFLILLPNDQSGLPFLEAAMFESKNTKSRKINLFEIWDKHRLHLYDNVHVFLPRFKINEKSNINQALKNLGLVNVFNDADFSKMSSEQKLRLSDISHATFLEVNEKGTEVHGSTSGGTVAAGVSDYREFKVNHPCLFMVYDYDTSLILFLGRLCHPSE